MSRAPLLFLLGLLPALPGMAAPSALPAVEVCFNYGCVSHRPVLFDAQRLQAVLQNLDEAGSPEEERARLAVAIGDLYALAAEQTPIGQDRGGNYADQGVFGRMDCVDHSTTTTRLLQLLEQQGGLHWHRVLEPARRTRGIIFQHYSAVIEARVASDDVPARRFVVDSWFVDNGKPAVILPLEAWMQGEGPDV
ncbi:MAG: hypothetical protein WBI41_04885 [Azovibrio sp.]|uniref:hypothetical protein n=1 Tax=Azovibrio sp. TaxID=1872673 RepID=UPI003C795571